MNTTSGKTPESDKITLVFATNNSHKMTELREKLDQRFELISLKEIGHTEDIPEEQDTLEGNALQKARTIHDLYGLNCFADDTGLEIEVLNNAPGVYSARYAGEYQDSLANMNKVLLELKDKSERKARFRTVIALIFNKKEHLFEGIVEGEILTEKRGDEGFGYDPIFQPLGYDLTFAEMPLSLKNEISHRGKAVGKLMHFLNTEI